jgi:hypothetical protein
MHNYSCHTEWVGWEVLNGRSFGGEKENKTLFVGVLLEQNVV